MYYDIVVALNLLSLNEENFGHALIASKRTLRGKEIVIKIIVIKIIW